MKIHMNENSRNDLEKENKFHYENDDFEKNKMFLRFYFRYRQRFLGFLFLPVLVLEMNR